MLFICHNILLVERVEQQGLVIWIDSTIFTLLLELRSLYETNTHSISAYEC